MKKTFLLIWLSVAISCVTDAAEIRILYRPSWNPLTSAYYLQLGPGPERTELLRWLKENPSAWVGHVAIELPTESGSEILGWRPRRDDLSVEQFNKALNRRKVLPGHLVNERIWARGGMSHPLTPTRFISLEVSETDLARIRVNVNAIREGGGFYQISAPEGEAALKPFSENAFNCITIFFEIFEGTSVDTALIPQSGHIRDFEGTAVAISHAWIDKGVTCADIVRLLSFPTGETSTDPEKEK